MSLYWFCIFLALVRANCITNTIDLRCVDYCGGICAARLFRYHDYCLPSGWVTPLYTVVNGRTTIASQYMYIAVYIYIYIQFGSIDVDNDKHRSSDKNQTTLLSRLFLYKGVTLHLYFKRKREKIYLDIYERCIVFYLNLLHRVWISLAKVSLNNPNARNVEGMSEN